jgi:hypothetical protein
VRAALLAGLVMAASLVIGSAHAASTAHGTPAVTLSAAVGSDGLELRLDTATPIPIAVFQRGGTLWVLVAAGPGEVAGWPSLARGGLAGWLEPLTSEPADGARLLRFALSRPAQIAAALGPAGWRIHLAAPSDVSGPVEGEDRFVRSAEHGALEAEVDGQVMAVTDPATGARLGVLVSAVPGLRQPQSAKLVEVELLPSAQGLVWHPLSDDLTASLEAGRLTLTRPGGLRLSPGTAMASAAAEPHLGNDQANAGLPTPPIGLAALGATDPATRQRTRLGLLAGMRQLTGLPRAIARLELAKLYLADALGPEARTALELIDTASLAEPAADMLRLSQAAMTGAAAAVAGQDDRALATLLDHRLDQDPEVALWRAYAAARTTRWDLAAQEWARSNELLDGYPAPLRRLLGLEMASAIVEQGDAGAALALIDRLRPVALSTDAQARLSLLEGLGLARSGRPSKADQALQSARDHGDRDIRTRAAFLLTSLRAERGALPAKEAAATFEAQQPGWRGHPWEARMLRRLAELQSATGKPAAALANWQAARALAPDATTVAAIDDEQRDRLRRLLAPGGEALPPVAALALYRTYGHLLGEDGADREIRLSLAKLAAENGLTETAAALLARPISGQAGSGAHDQTRTALDGASGGGAVRSRWAELRRQHDWPELARTTAPMMPPTEDAAPLDPVTAEAAVWLTLAEVELGEPGRAAERARHLAERASDRMQGALLQLAAEAGPTALPLAELPAAIGVYADTLLRELNLLPPLTGPSRPIVVRSAAERSNPAG